MTLAAQIASTIDRAARVRTVLVLRDPRGTLAAFCAHHVDTMVDPVAARAAIVRRDDTAHCIECDYHDPNAYDLTLGTSHDCPSDCAARVSLRAYEAALLTWPTLCTARHIGYQCTERKGHDALHRSRYAGILRHSWAPRRKAAPMA